MTGRHSWSRSRRAVQTENLNAISYFVPSMLGLSIMQVGIFAAIPLVGDREKLILKRLAATPLRRWQLVGSNVLMRILIAFAQTIIIVAVGGLAFGVGITGSLLLVIGFVTLGAMTFLSLGYVVASFAQTEDSANGMTSMIQFPMMFLSGAFFQIDQMPEFLQGIARVIPLTYLADALRQVMVGGTPFAPLWVCAAVLLGWLARVVRDRVHASSAGSNGDGQPASYQRSSRTIVARSWRPPAFGGRVSSAGSAG